MVRASSHPTRCLSDDFLFIDRPEAHMCYVFLFNSHNPLIQDSSHFQFRDFEALFQELVV